MLAFAVAAAGVGCAQAFGQSPASWVEPFNGHWADTEYWSTNPLYPNNGNPPGSSYDVTIAAAGNPFVVTFGDIAVTVNSLELSAANLSFRQSTGTLRLGTVDVGSGAAPLRITNGAIYDVFGGTLHLAAPDRASYIGAGSAARLRQFAGTVMQRGHLLVGMGSGTLGSGSGLIEMSGTARWLRDPAGNTGDSSTTIGVGPLGVGRLLPRSGAAATFTTLSVGAAGGHGSLLLDSETQITANRLNIGNGRWDIAGSGTSGFGAATISFSGARINLTSLDGTLPGILSIGGGSDGAGAGTLVISSGRLTAPLTNISSTGVLDIRGGYAELGTVLSMSGKTSLSGTGSIVSVGGSCNVTDGGELRITGGTFLMGHLSAASGTQTINVSGGTLSIGSITQTSGSSTFSGATTLDCDDITIGGSARFTLDGAAARTQSLTITGGSVNFAGGTFDMSRLRVTGGRFALAPDAGLRIDVEALHVDGAGVFDIGSGRVTIDYSGPSPVDEIARDVARGYAGGAWTGEGITSSRASADAFGVGYAEFAGATVVLRLARYGDANLDGHLNLIDFNLLAASFGLDSGAVWSQGDFNYDGRVDLRDFNRLASNFGVSASGPALTPQDWSNLAATVPEPGIAPLIAALLLARRRWR